MADNIVRFTFDDRILSQTPGNSTMSAYVDLTGRIDVDYTTASIAGTLTATFSSSLANSSSIPPGETFTPLGFADKGNNTFSLSVFDDQYVRKVNNEYTLAFDWSGSSPNQITNVHLSGEGGFFKADAEPVASSEPVGLVCFCEGTHIATSCGNVAIENLKIGDLVVTASGAHRSIVWLGHRTIDCRDHLRQSALPVLISAHAFESDRPARDLRVSPGHAVCIDLDGEVLIPAGSLVNGATVIREDIEHVTYWHVELDAHDIIVAENLPCESFLDMGNRTFFAESEIVALKATPDGTVPDATHANFCRPFHAGGALVDIVRKRLAARARQIGWHLEEQGLGDLHLLADGHRLDPLVTGLSVCFTVPAAARDVWLVSRTVAPSAIGYDADQRELGVQLSSLTIDDGMAAPRLVTADDLRLREGFYDVENVEDQCRRWTTGCTPLSNEFWNGIEGDFLLRLDLARPALPHWVAPVLNEDEARSPIAQGA